MNDSTGHLRVNQPLLFLGLRWRLTRNNLATILRSSPVRLLTILACSAVVWIGVYAGSAFGFYELKSQNIPLAGSIVGMLFDLLFVALAIMLVFSTGIILYSSLFSSPETAFLLSTPAAADQVFAYKFHGAVAFSSWAFVLLGSPVLIAYGLVFAVPWYFYALLPLFFVGFVLLPGSVGALICLVVVNAVPRRRKQVLAVAVVAVCLVVVLWAVHLVPATQAQTWNRDAVQAF